jgi:hypothetical protein
MNYDKLMGYPSTDNSVEKEAGLNTRISNWAWAGDCVRS